ncbi:MAG: hypothetical protein PHF19_09010 [Synergistales bacterium]|nr:hypothetical protein [Synergistales bacterium]
MIAWILFAAFVLLAAWQAFKGVRKTLRGEGCSNCSGCSGGCACSHILFSAGRGDVPPSDEERDAE